MQDTMELALADPQVTADFRTYVVRARAADDGAIRLQAVGNVLAAYVCVLRPKILGEDTPTVLGLRTMPLAAPAELDTTVSLASAADRLARMSGQTLFPVPPMTVRDTWTGITSPRSGWQPRGTVSFTVLEQAAHRGIREVAALVPQSPGAAVVQNARGAVWGRPIPGLDPVVPAGAAFAAMTLGFLSGAPAPAAAGAEPGEARLFSNGRWTRLSTPGGHVLIRPAAVL